MIVAGALIVAVAFLMDTTTMIAPAGPDDFARFVDDADLQRRQVMMVIAGSALVIAGAVFATRR